MVTPGPMVLIMRRVQLPNVNRMHAKALPHSNWRIDEFDVEDVDRELAAIRAEFQAREGEDGMYFYSRVLGGRWTAKHKQFVVDGISGYARNGTPAARCCQ